MFPSVKFKLLRSKRLIEELRDNYNEGFKEYPHKVLSDFDEEAKAFRLRVEGPGIDPLLESAIIIGDILHNLRSALDHMAVEIEGKTSKPRDVKDIKFPVHKERKTLENDRNIKAVRASFPKTAETILDGVNCCEDGNRLLWVMGQLNKIDKHRMLIMSYSIAHVKGICAVNDIDGVDVEGFDGWVGNGGVIGYVRSSTPYTITDPGTASYSAHFHEKGFLEGDEVISTLIRMHREVVSAVGKVEAVFSEELASASH